MNLISNKKWDDLFLDSIGKEIDKEEFERGIKTLYKDFKLSDPNIIYCSSPHDFRSKGKTEDIGQAIEFARSIKEPEEYLENSKKFWGVISILFKWSLGIEACNDAVYFGQLDYLLNRLETLEDDSNPRDYIGLLKSKYYRCYLQHTPDIFVIQPPTEVEMESNRLHSIKGPALKFRDGDEYYYIRGVQIDKEIFKSVQDRSITLEDFLKISNEEIKALVLWMYQELYGEEGIYQFISESLKEVDSYTHKTGDKTLCYTLFKGQLGERLKRIAYVRCYCPSTDRMFFLGVSSDCRLAKDAISSLYRIPRKLERHIKYINRQGERFTTILTKKGNEIKKNMTKEDFEDLTTISGDDYFRLMRYEY